MTQIQLSAITARLASAQASITLAEHHLDAALSRPEIEGDDWFAELDYEIVAMWEGMLHQARVEEADLLAAAPSAAQVLVRLVPAGVNPKTVTPARCTYAEIVAHLNATCGREDQVAPGVYRVQRPGRAPELAGEALDYLAYGDFRGPAFEGSSYEVEDGQVYLSGTTDVTLTHLLTGFAPETYGGYEVLHTPGYAPAALLQGHCSPASIEGPGDDNANDWFLMYGRPDCTGNSVVMFNLR